MNIIEKEIVVCGKIFTLIQARNTNGKLQIEYSCEEIHLLRLHIDYSRDLPYWFEMSGSPSNLFKTDIEAFDGIYERSEGKTSSLIDNAKRDIVALNENLKEAKERLKRYSRYSSILEEMYKECKENLGIKDIIE